jgi:hypothetical protein
MVAVALSLRAWQIDQHRHNPPAASVVALKGGFRHIYYDCI